MAKVIKLEADIEGVLMNHDFEKLKRLLKLLHTKGSYVLTAKPK